MATFIPTLEEIKNNRMEQPTKGEWYFLQQLTELPDTYEVYFQPHINLSHPDIVILHPKGGALIVEVKDWKLDAYDFIADFNYSRFGVMREKVTGHMIRNPFEQVHMYKEELYQIYSPALYVGRLTEAKTYNVVKAGMFFYNASLEEVKAKFGEQNFKGDNFLRFFFCFARDSVSITNRIRYLLNPNPYFTTEIYEQIRAVLVPSMEIYEQSKFFSLSKEQGKYAISQPGKRQKIKGVAGSGKTLVLAERAVSCYKRIKEPVLILTFNVTLPNYIRDKIMQNTRDMSAYDRKQFHILHVNDFVKQVLDKYSIYYPKASYGTNPIQLLESRIQILQKYKERIHYKYQAILIDEVQDFEYNWLSQLEDLFLAPQGEFVLFGDEKQNIYNRSVDENRLPRTRISGPWHQLKECYRLTRANGQLAEEFQNQYFQGKYQSTKMEYAQFHLEDINVRQELRYVPLVDSEQNISNILQVIEGFRRDGKVIAPNDICVLSGNCAMLRELDYFYRTQLHVQSKMTCESKEEFLALFQAVQEGKIKKEQFEKELDGLRKIKKQGFQMNPGVMKLSTIHSFKGWEINTVILVLDSKTEAALQDELIYTAITRAKRNLVIINTGNQRYHDFFQSKM